MCRRPARISTTASTSSAVGAGRPCASLAVLSRTRAARSACSARACRAQRGRSGTAKSPAKSECGVTTPCAHATLARLPHRSSASTYWRIACFVSRAWSTGWHRCAVARWTHQPCSSCHTALPLTSSTSTPTSGIRTTRSPSWSVTSSVSRTPASSTSPGGRVSRRRSHTSRSEVVANVGSSGTQRAVTGACSRRVPHPGGSSSLNRRRHHRWRSALWPLRARARLGPCATHGACRSIRRPTRRIPSPRRRERGRRTASLLRARAAGCRPRMRPGRRTASRTATATRARRRATAATA